MKQFRKNEEKFFICEECKKPYNAKHDISHHISIKHNKKEYHNKWLKEEKEGFCKICGKQTEFKSLSLGYKNCCSEICTIKLWKKTCLQKFGTENPSQSKEVKEKRKQTCLEKFGVENPFQSKEIKEKIKESNLKNYGVDHNMKCEKGLKEYSQEIYKKYGVEHVLQNKKIHEKFEQTCLKRFGVENPFQSEEKKDKIKQTCLEKYGVEHPSQNKDIHDRQQKTGFSVKKFKNTNINYRGTYELDFLENYYFEYPDIENGSIIKYLFNGKEHYYFPDFCIPSLNLIVEIKNSYNAEKDKRKIKAKEYATKENNLNYIMIVNKNYFQFNKLNKNKT